MSLLALLADESLNWPEAFIYAAMLAFIAWLLR